MKEEGIIEKYRKNDILSYTSYEEEFKGGKFRSIPAPGFDLEGQRIDISGEKFGVSM